MAQIINDPNRTVQGQLTRSLGEGLTSIVNRYQQGQQQNKLVSALTGQFPNMQQQELQGLASLLQQNPQSINEVIKQKLQQPSQAAYAQALHGILGGEENQPIPQGLTAQQASQLADFGLKKQKQIAESQKELKPFLQGHGQDLKNAKQLHEKAAGMLKILNQYGDKFPSSLIGIAPEKIQEQLIRDPKVRKYMADANTLVNLLASSRKGVPTNFKIKLEQASKPNITQPLETQRALLQDIVNSSQDIFSTDEQIRRLKKENKGLYPTDLIERLVEEEGLPGNKSGSTGQSVSSVDAASIPNGKKARNSKTGEVFVWNGSEWIPEGA